ncbi:hypothetical protein [Mitsuokella jalaludinii]|uniref:hypothetical protein n=1 Tax=Mitsuokella jalaludinii TaxID=187979 RepID=UPI003F9BDA45
MNWQENPFYILQIPMTATKSVINDKTDDLCFDNPDHEEMYEEARSLLSNPQKRISAEIRWFPGLSDAEDRKLRADLSQQKLLSGIFANDLVRMNALIYNLTCEKDDQIIIVLADIDRLYQKISLEDVRMWINVTRQKARITPIQNIEILRTDWNEVRNDVRSAVHSVVKGMRRERYTRFANELAKKIFGRKDFGVILEDFFSAYQLDMNAFIMEKKEKIYQVLQRVADSPDENSIKALEMEIQPFSSVIRPVAMMQEAKGIDDSAGAFEIYRKVYDLSVDFYKADKDKYALLLLQLLNRAFSYVIWIKRQLEHDIPIVQESVNANQRTVVFEEANKAIKEILDEEDKKLYFKNGHNGQIMSFYRNEFSNCYRKVIEEFIKRNGYQPEEYRIICYGAGLIYRQMANSLTWADRYDLAFELLQYAYKYARNSEDQELIKKIQDEKNNVHDSWEAQKQSKKKKETVSAATPSYSPPRTSSSPQTPAKESDDSSSSGGGCLLMLLFAAIGGAIGGPVGFFAGIFLGSYLSNQD